MFLHVARLAWLLAMLAFETESSLREMVESLPVQANQREPFPVMFHMAAGTIRLAGRIPDCARVKPRAPLHAALNLAVTLQAFETAAAASKIVAGSAFGHTFQLLVNPRQGAWRDLRRRGRASSQHRNDDAACEP